MHRSTRSWVVGVCVVFTSIVTASAADLTRPIYKAEPYLTPAPVFSWTGFYIGAHAGYGWSNLSGSGPFGGSSITAKGPLGGGQVGYNYQIGQFVLGVEGEYSFANVKYDTPLFAGTLTLKNDYFITAAARLGYAFDRYLVYGKVGGAWTRDKWDGTDGIGGTLTGTSNRSGWMLGAGLEYAFLGNWSAKLEYDYLIFGAVTPILTTTGTLGVVGTASIKMNTQIVKAGLNYRFNTF